MGRAFEYRRAAKEKRWDKMSKTFPKLARSISSFRQPQRRNKSSNTQAGLLVKKVSKKVPFVSYRSSFRPSIKTFTLGSD